MNAANTRKKEKPERNNRFHQKCCLKFQNEISTEDSFLDEMCVPSKIMLWWSRVARMGHGKGKTAREDERLCGRVCCYR